MLNLDRLATFVCLAQEGNFSRAAEQLDVTQPAVTQHVQLLERDLGVRLVDRVGRRTHLTDVGAAVAERAARLLSEARALERDVRDLAEARAGVLRVGATLTIGGYLLPALIARFAKRFPAIHVEVVVENTAAIVPRVIDATLGVALVEGDCEGPELEIIPFADDELVIIAPPSHPLARRRLHAGDLAGENFVTREEGSGTRAVFERGMKKAGIEPRITLALPTSEGIIRAVQHGIGLAMVSRLVAEEALAHGTLVRLDVADIDLSRTFRLVRLRQRTPSPAAARFMEMILPRRAPEA